MGERRRRLAVQLLDAATFGRRRLGDRPPHATREEREELVPREAGVAGRRAGRDARVGTVVGCERPLDGATRARGIDTERGERRLRGLERGGQADPRPPPASSPRSAPSRARRRRPGRRPRPGRPPRRRRDTARRRPARSHRPQRAPPGPAGRQPSRSTRRLPPRPREPCAARRSCRRTTAPPCGRPRHRRRTSCTGRARPKATPQR
jgi:hypothetical protein